MIDPSYLLSGPGDFYKKVICVDSCPTYSTSPTLAELKTLGELAIGCKDTTISATFSDTDINPTYSAGSNTGCQTFKAYKSKSFLGLYCTPDMDWVNSSASTLSEIVSNVDLFCIYIINIAIASWLHNISNKCNCASYNQCSCRSIILHSENEF